MKSEKLDNMSMDEVYKAIVAGGNAEYWIRVARCKLAEYARTMPSLERFVNTDWRHIHANWTSKVNEAERGLRAKSFIS